MATIFNMLGLPEEEQPYVPAPLLASFQPQQQKDVVPGTVASKKTQVSESEKIPMNQYQPTYSKQFDDAFHESMDLRKEDLEALKRKLAETQGAKPTGFAALDLKPFAGFADYLTGSRTAQNFGEPKAVERHMAEMDKLEKAIRADSNSVSDDQLNYLKLKAQEEQYKQRESAAEARLAKGDRHMEFRLREKWENHPVTKASQSMDDHYRRISSVPADTPQGQMSMIFAYMKMLDDGSVVRESEYAQAARTAGLYDRAALAVQTLKKGDKLDAEQIRKFRESAEAIMAEVRQKQEAHDMSYKSLASEYGFKPERVAYGVGFKKKEEKKTITLDDLEKMTDEELKDFAK